MSSSLTYAVTGATGVIGFEIARLIAETGATVYLFARNKSKIENTINKLRKRTNNQKIFYELADLSSKKSIIDLRKRWGDRELDVLVNDHVICPKKRVETEEGIELNFACNVLGYFWLIENFQDILNKTAQGNENKSRIVNVVSYWAGRLDFGDLEFKKRRYNNVDAYFQCKQADRMLTQYYAKTFSEKKIMIDINSSMSGDVESQCSYDLNCPVPGSPTEAARTPANIATGKLGFGLTGEYFSDCRKARKEGYEKNWDDIFRLYQICQKY